MIVLFEPILKETLWGGTLLKKTYPKSKLSTIGECLGIGAFTKISNGVHQGKTAGEVFQEDPAFFGLTGWNSFPISVKWIDAFDDLSIQVHPDNSTLLKRNEFWYVMDCLPYTDIIISHKAKTKAEFLNDIEEGDYHHLLKTYRIQPGNSFYIAPGTIHAICKGTFLLEVQTANEQMYRFYDYDRLVQGKKRELHLRQAVATTRVPDKIDPLINPHRTFEVEIQDIDKETKILHFEGMFFSVIEGSLSIENQVCDKGSFGFVKASPETVVSGNAKVAWIWMIAQ